MAVQKKSKKVSAKKKVTPRSTKKVRPTNDMLEAQVRLILSELEATVRALKDGYRADVRTILKEIDAAKLDRIKRKLNI